jgi:hypothetical protein
MARFIVRDAQPDDPMFGLLQVTRVPAPLTHDEDEDIDVDDDQGRRTASREP